MSAQSLAHCVWLFAVLEFFSGCSSTPDRNTIRMSAEAVPNLSRAVRDLRSGDSLDRDQANEALDKDYFVVLSDCSQALSRFESEGQRRSRLAQSLAFGGLLAGSVAVPALTAASAMGNAAWIGGLGGFAGATNTAQHWIQQSGLSYVESLRTREQIRTEFKTAIEDFFASDDPVKRRQSLLRAKAACVLYAVSIPDVKVVQQDDTTDDAGGSGPDQGAQAEPSGSDSQAQQPEEQSPQEPEESSPQEPDPQEPDAEPEEAPGEEEAAAGAATPGA